MHFPIIDSHLHLWDNRQLNYPWLESIPLLNKPFLLSELLNATHSLHLESFVFVQAESHVDQALKEVEWVTDMAKRDSRIRGIVAQCSLESGLNAKQHLATLKKNPLVKGVRRLLMTETDEFCVQENFIQGVKLLADYNFSFDICNHAHQLPAIIKMVEQCPKVKFSLNHLGRPNVAEKKLQPWQDHMKQLALLPNVWCKISGLITQANHTNWCSDDLKPYIYHAIDVFGVNRVMFGSDWPVVDLAGSYSHWVHTLYDLLMHWSIEKEWKKLFSENAQHFYDLNPVVSDV